MAEIKILEVGSHLQNVDGVPIKLYSVYSMDQRFSAYVVSCEVGVDKDGSPRAYGLNRPDGANSQSGLAPIENIGNATTAGKHYKDHVKYEWCGVVSVTKAYDTWYNTPVRKFIIDEREAVKATGGAKKDSDYLALHRPGENVSQVGAYPVVQGPNDVAPGYYVSQNRLIVDDQKNFMNKVGMGMPSRFLTRC